MAMMHIVQLNRGWVFNILFSLFFLSACAPSNEDENIADGTDAIVAGTHRNPVNQAPVAEIVAPIGNRTISEGQSVIFQGRGTDADNNTPLSYLWSFDGIIPNSQAQNPGEIIFPHAGVYRVRLSVTDSLGLSSSNVVERTIVVTGVGVTNQSPNGQIISPAQNMSIRVGDSLNLSGSGSDADRNTPLSYFWDMDGAVPNFATQNPGNVVFNQAGTYQIRLIVSDSLGLQDSTPAQVTITVSGGNNFNQAPNGTIISPTTDVVINQGDVLNFIGTGSDPNGDTPLSYAWFYDGAVPVSNGQNPGNVTFNQPGDFLVKLTVSDSTGLADPTPATRRVVVRAVNNDNEAPNGNIISPASDMTIQEGTELFFSANGSDPDNDYPLAYFWNFDGAWVNVTSQNAGRVVFNQAGTYYIQLSVQDSLGLQDPSPAVRRIVVQKSNAPTGNLPPEGQIILPTTHQIINVGQTIAFSGSGSDPDNNQPLSYRWNLDGVMPNTTNQNPGNITFSKVGTYQISLTVTDALGLSDPTPQVRIVQVRSVQSSNTPPSGRIDSPRGDRSIEAGSSISFSASGSDIDGNLPLRYIWHFAGAAPNFIGANPGNIIFERAGTYAVSMTVIDSLGAADPSPEIRTITVSNNRPTGAPPNGRIVSPGTDVTINAGERLFFTATGSSPDSNTPLSYFWDMDGGANNSSSQSPGNVRFDRAGVYRIALTVTDSIGLLDLTPAVRTVTVLGGQVNQAPDTTMVAPSADRVINVGESVYFVATATDPENDLPISYRWDFNGGAVNSNLQSPGYVAFNRVGTYVVRVTATDSLGNSDATPALRTITVQQASNSNSPPNGQITSPLNNVTIDANQTVNFTSTGSDPDGDLPLRYFWNFNGVIANSSQQNPGNIRFPNPGTYAVSLTVSDNRNLADATPDIRIITVRDQQPVGNAPEGRIVAPGSNVSINRGESVYFTATVRDDSDNSPYTYEWDFDNARSNFIGQKPGNITFNNSGTYRVRLNVRNRFGVADPTPAERVITVGTVQGNLPPDSRIDNPSGDRVIVLGSSLSFSGTGIDPEGQAMSYLWTFGDGRSSSSRNPGSISFNQVGTYQVRFTASDNLGQADPTPATVTINVVNQPNANNPPNGRIVLPSGAVSVTAGNGVLFTGSAIDPDNDTPIRYHWNFAGAAPNSAAQNPGFVVFNNPGTYRVRLHVTDNLGLADPTPAEVVVTVTGNNSNNPPNGTIRTPSGNLMIELGATVNFTARATDPDGDNMTYLWDYDGALPNSNARDPGSVSFNQVGTFTVRFIVSDEFGLQDPTPDSVVISVSNPQNLNQAPTGAIVTPTSDVTIYAGDSLDLRATGSDPDGNLPLSFNWDMNGAASNSNQQNPGNVRFNIPGVYRIRMLVRDSQGLADPTPAERLITVRGVAVDMNAPNGTITSPSTNQTIDAGQSLNFSANANDPDNDFPLRYFWNMDGAAPNFTVLNPGNVVFNNPGTYRIRFTVTDAVGLSDPIPAEIIVQVLPTDQPPANAQRPNGSIVSPREHMSITVGETVYFDGSGNDPDGLNGLISYRWDFAGAVPNSNVKSPGNVTFDEVGTYRIRLTVTDAQGLSDLTPAERIISVKSPTSNNNPPETWLISPTQSQTIATGNSVYFNAAGSDPENHLPLRFYWDFAGVAPNSIGQTPGDVSFTQPGIYYVMVRAVDALGLADDTPAFVIITVQDQPQSNSAPNAIISPSTNQTISIGQSIVFQGNATDPDGNGPFTFRWDFGSVRPATSLQNPGSVLFDQAGVYTIRLTVWDDQRIVDATPAEITVTVNDGGNGGNRAPNGQISSPSRDITLNRGESVDFRGSASDPDGDGVSYRWDMDGVVPNTTRQNPGIVRFDKSGVYVIKLIVTDTKSLSDPTPPTRTITVR